jgi:PPE-repeat protein
MTETHRGYRYEFLDADSGTSHIEVGPDPAEGRASDRGAGTLGFAGTAQREGVAAGLASLPGDGFGGGPAEPMVPGTWEPDQPL